VSSSKEIGADHFETVAAGFARAEHQCRRFKRSLNHRQLALVEFEINDFPRLRLLARQMPLNFPLESFLWKLDRFVQPGCTVKPFAVSPGYFCQFGCFGPPHLLQVVVNAARQLLVDRHQVVGFAPGLREPFRQKIIEGTEVFELPVLTSSHFAQVLTEFDEPRVLLLLGMALPGQDLIDLVENEQRTTAIQLGFHERTPVSRQIG
jgi:hypothetical protein